MRDNLEPAINTTIIEQHSTLPRGSLGYTLDPEQDLRHDSVTDESAHLHPSPGVLKPIFEAKGPSLDTNQSSYPHFDEPTRGRDSTPKSQSYAAQTFRTFDSNEPPGCGSQRERLISPSHRIRDDRDLPTAHHVNNPDWPLPADAPLPNMTPAFSEDSSDDAAEVVTAGSLRKLKTSLKRGAASLRASCRNKKVKMGHDGKQPQGEEDDDDDDGKMKGLRLRPTIMGLPWFRGVQINPFRQSKNVVKPAHTATTQDEIRQETSKASQDVEQGDDGGFDVITASEVIEAQQNDDQGVLGSVQGDEDTDASLGVTIASEDPSLQEDHSRLAVTIHKTPDPEVENQTTKIEQRLPRQVSAYIVDIQYYYPQDSNEDLSDTGNTLIESDSASVSRRDSLGEELVDVADVVMPPPNTSPDLHPLATRIYNFQCEKIYNLLLLHNPKNQLCFARSNYHLVHEELGVVNTIWREVLQHIDLLAKDRPLEPGLSIYDLYNGMRLMKRVLVRCQDCAAELTIARASWEKILDAEKSAASFQYRMEEDDFESSCLRYPRLNESLVKDQMKFAVKVLREAKGRNTFTGDQVHTNCDSGAATLPGSQRSVQSTLQSMENGNPNLSTLDREALRRWGDVTNSVSRIPHPLKKPFNIVKDLAHQESSGKHQQLLPRKGNAHKRSALPQAWLKGKSYSQPELIPLGTALAPNSATSLTRTDVPEALCRPYSPSSSEHSYKTAFSRYNPRSAPGLTSWLSDVSTPGKTTQLPQWGKDPGAFSRRSRIKSMDPSSLVREVEESLPQQPVPSPYAHDAAKRSTWTQDSTTIVPAATPRSVEVHSSTLAWDMASSPTSPESRPASGLEAFTAEGGWLRKPMFARPHSSTFILVDKGKDILEWEASSSETETAHPSVTESQPESAAADQFDSNAADEAEISVEDSRLGPASVEPTFVATLPFRSAACASRPPPLPVPSPEPMTHQVSSLSPVHDHCTVPSTSTLCLYLRQVGEINRKITREEIQAQSSENDRAESAEMASLCERFKADPGLAIYVDRDGVAKLMRDV